MSYLKLPNGVPDFSKAVFSLWFRVPRESVIAASNHSLPPAKWPMMQNILPLITFGRPQQNQAYTFIINPNVVTNNPDTVLARPVGYQATGPYDVDPSYIGVECYSDGTFYMAFNLQTGTFGTYNSLLWFLTNLNYEEGAQPYPIGNGYVGTGTGSHKSTIKEGTGYVQDAQPEYFLVSGNNKLASDVWHHVLLSFDIGGSLSIGNKPSSNCQLWYAIDNTDYRGWENLQPYRDGNDGLGKNTIVTQNVYRQSGFTETEPPLFYNNYVPLPSGGFSGGMLPSSGAELGLPAASHYVDGIFRAEMAELQIWTGVTLETGNESNRRAFIKDGKPVDPTGTEAKPAPAVSLLGKKPEVMLHGNSNWQAGYNTGTLGVAIETDPDGTETVTKLPGGQFTPVAGIEKYKPEPSLSPA